MKREGMNWNELKLYSEKVETKQKEKLKKKLGEKYAMFPSSNSWANERQRNVEIMNYVSFTLKAQSFHPHPFCPYCE